jgi:hypothetical protein
LFFSFFNTILYDDQYITDLSKALTSIDLDDPKYMYDEYYVQDGERPDSVSNKFYNVPYYHWVILITNKMTLKDWPKSDKVMSKFMDWKYGDTPKTIERYEDSSGIIVSEKFPASFIDQDGNTQSYYFNGDGLGAIKNNIVYGLGKPISTYDSLVIENDKKKNIKILDKRYLPEITDLAKSLLR